MNQSRIVIKPRWGRPGVVGALCLLLCSCSSGGPQPENELATVPVTGEIHLDGQPAWGMEVKLIQQGGSPLPFAVRARTTEDGKFQMTSYRRNDGAPAGEYKLIFLHYGEPRMSAANAEAEDLLKGKYKKVEDSTHSVSVPEGGDPVDMGVIELTSE